jgi:hypothetical protein
MDESIRENVLVTLPGGTVTRQIITFYDDANIYHRTTGTTIVPVVDQWAYTQFTGTIPGPNDGTMSLYGGGELTKDLIDAAIARRIIEHGEDALVLSSIEVMEDFTSLGNNAFEGNTALTSIVFSPSSLTNFGTSVFKDYTALAELVLPSNLTGLPDNMCQGCSVLQNPLLVPESVVSFGDRVFSQCAILDNIVVPKSVQTIGANVFENCTELRSVNFAPDSVITTIGAELFKNCTTLKSMEFLITLTTIGSGTFDGASSVQIVRMERSIWALVEPTLQEAIVSFHSDPLY